MALNSLGERRLQKYDNGNEIGLAKAIPRSTIEAAFWGRQDLRGSNHGFGFDLSLQYCRIPLEYFSGTIASRILRRYYGIWIQFRVAVLCQHLSVMDEPRQGKSQNLEVVKLEVVRFLLCSRSTL